MRIIDYKKLTNLKWLNLFNVLYIDKNGDKKIWQVASRAKEPKCVTASFVKPDAVIIVPFHISKEKLVIIKEYRVPIADYEYGFPAGLIDEGETIQEAARRELNEETGLEVTRFTKISQPIFSSAGMTDESISMVYVECDGEPLKDGNEVTEEIEVIFISQKEAVQLCNDSSLKFDAKAWIVVSNFAEFGYF
jgi:ADP-ribose pyrophosphatase